MNGTGPVVALALVCAAIAVLAGWSLAREGARVHQLFRESAARLRADIDRILNREEH